MEIIFQKQNDYFIPCPGLDAEKLENVKNGEYVRCKTTKARNGAFHRKYFGLLHFVFDNQDKYDVFEAFRAEVTMKAGYYHEHQHINGHVSYMPKSIQFSKMDEVEFRDLVNKTIDVIMRDFMKDADRNVIENVACF